MKKKSLKKKKTFSIEARGEDIYTLTKIILGGVLGFVLGAVGIIGAFGFIIGILALIVFFIVGRHIFKLSAVNPIKLLLWDGTVSFFLFMIITWAITINVLGIIPPP